MMEMEPPTKWEIIEAVVWMVIVGVIGAVILWAWWT